MKARVDAGTDVAMIGAWDAGGNASPFTAAERGDHLQSLEREASEGRLFLIHTGGDGSGPVDVYVDEAVPAPVHARVRPIAENVLLSVPGGALTVGGVEDYRSDELRLTGPGSVLQIPAGNYALRCFVPRDPEQESSAEQLLREAVPADDIKYYDRINSRGCAAGALTPLLFPLLALVIDWRIALAITAAVFLSFFPVREWSLKRNARYQRLHDIIPRARLEHEDPMAILELTRVDHVSHLKGMSARL
jgi:hypothetical protein